MQSGIKGVPEKNANIHQRVRDEHQSEIAHDYLEAIYRLLAENKGTRVTDIQNVFGVSHVTVIKTLGRLEQSGLLSRSSGGVQLTEEGLSIATKAYQKHQLVLKFLRVLGVPEEVAQKDTEGIEHHLSKETLEAMDKFIRS